MDCYYIKTAKVCGSNSAYLMRELTDAVMKNVLTSDCRVGRTVPTVKETSSFGITQIFKMKSNGINNSLNIQVIF